MDQCPCRTGRYSIDPIPNASMIATCVDCPEGYRCPRYSFYGLSIITKYTSSTLLPYLNCWSPALCDASNATCNPESVYCPANSTNYKIVPSGFYSLTGSDNIAKRSTRIAPCPKGNYCMKGRVIKCAKGKYADKTGATSCDMCPPGKYARESGSENCAICEKGYQCPRGAIMEVRCGCVAPHDKKVNELNTVHNEEEECPKGWDKSERPGDSYCPKNSGTPKYPPKGTFTLGGIDPLSIIKFDKPFDKPKEWLIKYGTEYRQYEGTDDDTSVEGLIEKAEWNGVLKKNFQKFDTLYIKVTKGLDNILKMKPGERKMAIGDNEKVGVTINSTKPNFDGGMRRDRLEPCAEGYRCKQGREFFCEVGTYALGTRNSVCKACSPGKFANETATGDCELCPKGFYQNVPKSTSCEECATGQFAENSQTDLCKKCPAGYYGPVKKLTKCTACERGKFQVSQSQASCKHCDPGKDSNGTTALSEACTSCAGGHYRPKFIHGLNSQCLNETLSSDPDNYEAAKSERGKCVIGFPVCARCEPHSHGCGSEIAPIFIEGELQKFEERVEWSDDETFFKLKDTDDEEVKFDSSLKKLIQETMDNHTTFWAGSHCVRKKDDDAKGAKCEECPAGYEASGDRQECLDSQGISQLIAGMVDAKEWTLESFFDGKNGDAHAMKVTLKIPQSMDHKRLKIVKYQLDVSMDPGFGTYVCKEGVLECANKADIDKRFSPVVEVSADGEQHEFEFKFRLPNSTATLYDKTYYVRAYPVIQIDGGGGNPQEYPTKEYDIDQRVLSEPFPKKRWKVISDCGGTDFKYLETRCPKLKKPATAAKDCGENAFPGEDIDDPTWENWQCVECPKGASCRGDSESHWRTMVALFGYWRARDQNVSRLAMDNTLYTGRIKFYKCPRPWACLGRKNVLFADRGWGRKNKTFMSGRAACCEWSFGGTCGEEYEVENDLGEKVKKTAECEIGYTFKEGCAEICRDKEYEEPVMFSEKTTKKFGEVCEENKKCKPPDPALMDHPEKCADGYVGLTCGNCYNPYNDPTDPCSTDPTYEQVGVGADGKNELLNCDRRKYFLKKGGCEVCPPPRFEVDLGIMLLMVIGFIVALYIFWKFILMRLFKFFMKYKILFNDVKNSLKLILDFLQILNSISSVITIEFPPMMEGFLDSFSGLISFDIKVLMGMPCVDVGGDGITAYGQEVAVPFVLVFMVLSMFAFNALRAKGLCPKFCGGRIVVIEKDTGPKVNKLKRRSMTVIRDMQKGTFNAHARHSSKSVSGTGLNALSQKFGQGIFDKKDPPAVQKGVMDLWYTTLNVSWTILTFYHVPITSKSFNMFRCEEVEGLDYLNMDYNIQCWQPRHYMGMLAASIVIIFYIIGLPFGVAYHLYRNIKKLHTPHMVKSFGYMYMMFYPHARWYWGTVIAMGRKIILAGALIVLYRQKVIQITIGIIYCSALLVILQHVRPFKMTIANYMTTISWTGITLIYSIPLTKEAIKSSPTPGESAQAVLVDNYCMFIIYGTMTSMFLGMFVQMRITWLKFKAIQGVNNFDQNDYSWLYMDEKDLKAKAARDHAAKAKNTTGKAKSLFSSRKEKNSGSKKVGDTPGRSRGFGLRNKISFRKKPKVMVAPTPIKDDDPFGLNAIQMNSPNVTANKKLPSHLVNRIQDRRQKRNSMRSSELKRRETGRKIMRRKSFDASSMIDESKFNKFDNDEGGKSQKPSRRSSSNTTASRGLKRQPSAKMIAMSNAHSQSNVAGDLLVVQPRRHLLGRKKFEKLDPDAEDRKLAKIKAKTLKIKQKQELEDKRFKVFLTAAVKKGYFANLEPDSDEYKAKYEKLVSKYKYKYEQAQAQESSSSSEEEQEDNPTPIMLKTRTPVVNAFGKSGNELKSALLSHGATPKYESDTMQEI